MTDKEMIEAIRSGDTAAARELDLRWRPRLVAQARQILGNEEKAEDAAQVALLRVWWYLDRFDVSRSLGPWIMKIGENVARSFLKHRGRDPLWNATEVSERQIAYMDDGPEEGEIRVALQDCFDQLEPESQNIVVSTYWWGYSLQQAGRFLDLPKTTVQSRLKRVLERLRQCMKSKGF